MGLNNNCYLTSGGVLSHTQAGSSTSWSCWRREKKLKTGGGGSEAVCPSRDLYSTINGGGKGKGGGGQGGQCQSLHCAHLPKHPPVFLCIPHPHSPPSLPPLFLHHPLGVYLSDKKKKEAAARSRHGAVCLGRLPQWTRDWVRGPQGGAPHSFPAFVSTPHSPRSPPPLCRNPLWRDETAGLLGRAGLRIRLRLARVGWQMAAWAPVRLLTHPTGAPAFFSPPNTHTHTRETAKILPGWRGSRVGTALEN